MIDGGVYTLASMAVTTALSGTTLTAIEDLDGMTAVTVEAAWSGAAGGTSVTARVRTSFDGGTVWREVVRFDFSTSAAVKHANLSGLTAKAVTSYAALNADSVSDGVLGDRLEVEVSSVGTFTGAGGTLVIRASVR